MPGIITLLKNISFVTEFECYLSETFLLSRAQIPILFLQVCVFFDKLLQHIEKKRNQKSMEIPPCHKSNITFLLVVYSLHCPLKLTLASVKWCFSQLLDPKMISRYPGN